MTASEVPKCRVLLVIKTAPTAPTVPRTPPTHCQPRPLQAAPGAGGALPSSQGSGMGAHTRTVASPPPVANRPGKGDAPTAQTPCLIGGAEQERELSNVERRLAFVHTMLRSYSPPRTVDNRRSERAVWRLKLDSCVSSRETTTCSQMTRIAVRSLDGSGGYHLGYFPRIRFLQEVHDSRVGGTLLRHAPRLIKSFEPPVHAWLAQYPPEPTCALPTKLSTSTPADPRYPAQASPTPERRRLRIH